VSELKRTLSLGGAVVVGVGSMIGAGVFAAWSPAATAAGDGLLIGLAVAGFVAFCNATSSAQLAAIHPESGGTYVYARRQLGEGWGHAAGWGFVVGKTASCVAMALTVGAYLAPDSARTVAVAAVALVTAVNIGGLSRTVAVTCALLAVSLGSLAVVVISGWAHVEPAGGGIDLGEGGVYGVLQSAGYLFFAFAGYARVATLGEEVVDPERTIPRAIPAALGGVLVVYAIVALTLLRTIPTRELGPLDAPLQRVLEDANSSFAVFVQIGAAIAALGVLLNLIPGISRTTLAMARQRELPHWLAHVDRTRSLPLRAEVTVAATVISLILVLDLRDAIAVSGVAVLLYYAITNGAALTLPSSQRRFPKAFAVVGLAGCVVLIGALPVQALVGGGGVILCGIGVRQIVGRRRDQPAV